MRQLLHGPLAIAVASAVARGRQVTHAAHQLVVANAEDVLERRRRLVPLATLEVTFGTPERRAVARVRRRPFVLVLVFHGRRY